MYFNGYGPADAGLPNYQWIFSKAGTYVWEKTPEVFLYHIIVIASGGGGGGGAGRSAGAQGGGGGGGGPGLPISCLIAGDLLPSRLKITVGAGGNFGAGGVSGSGSAGTGDRKSVV